MKEIRLIIFDLDGTLYKLSDVVSMNYQMQVDFYSAFNGISPEATIKIFEENNIYPVMNEKSKSATEFFAKAGIPISTWNKYREENFDVESIKTETSVNIDVLFNYQNLMCPLILLSSNSLSNIRRILYHLNVKESVFNEIICSDTKHGKNGFSKIEEMKLLSERFGIDVTKMFSIGDRKRTDVDPILSLGGHGAVVREPGSLKQLYIDIMKQRIGDCGLYKYYS